jgi:hypothetical protein
MEMEKRHGTQTGIASSPQFKKAMEALSKNAYEACVKEVNFWKASEFITPCSERELKG